MNSLKTWKSLKLLTKISMWGDHWGCNSKEMNCWLHEWTLSVRSIIKLRKTELTPNFSDFTSSSSKRTKYSHHIVMTPVWCLADTKKLLNTEIWWKIGNTTKWINTNSRITQKENLNQCSFSRNYLHGCASSDRYQDDLRH